MAHVCRVLFAFIPHAVFFSVVVRLVAGLTVHIYMHIYA